ncbi:MAG: sugar ABC transporter permease [Chloroflexi bacterium]|nr:sugar ABC transporter permease [Chloroflexota bacterium]
MSNSALPATLVGSKRRVRARHWRHSNLAGYLFISPWLIGYLLFALMPILASLMLSFTNYDVLGHNILRGDWDFVGLDNFEKMFYHDYRYWKSVKATLNYVVFAVPLRLMFALAVAMLLNTKRHGVYFYRAAYYTPSVVGGSVAVALMWREIFQRDGLVNNILGTEIYWFGNPDYAMWVLVTLAVWQFGSPMLVFLAGLRQIPQDMYEAASIDGANFFQRFWRITIPLLTPIIFFNLVMQTINGFQQFTQAFIVTGGRPLDRTLLYPLYVYNRGFVSFQMGYASAMAWVLLVTIAFFTLILFASSRLWVYYQGDEGKS